MGYAKAIGNGMGARNPGDMVKERNARSVIADRWRAEHPGPLDDDLAFRIGEWVENGGPVPPWEPLPPAAAVYPPLPR